MDSHINYILIGLIVAIILHLLFKTINKCGKENMMPHITNTAECKRGYDPYILQYADVNGDDGLFEKMRRHDELDSSMFVNEPESLSGSSEENRSEEMQNDLDATIKEYAKYGRLEQGDEAILKYSNEEINDYRQNFLDFRSKTENTSGGIDMVDKMNIMQAESGGADISKNYKGRRISDVYDDLTKNLKGEATSVINPEFDPLTMTNNYKSHGHNGDSLRKYHFRYYQDKVENGGKFYGDIEGYDPSSDSQLSL
jgi:hypothetical protein